MQKSTQIVCSNNVENSRKMPKTIKNAIFANYT